MTLFTASKNPDLRPMTPSERDEAEFENDQLGNVGLLDIEREQRFLRENGYATTVDLDTLEPGDVHSAWDLIGYEGPYGVRVVGGRTIYDGVFYNDETARSDKVWLKRLTTDSGLGVIERKVDPDTEIEIVDDLDDLIKESNGL